MLLLIEGEIEMAKVMKKNPLYRGPAVSVLGFKAATNTAIAANLYLRKRGATTEEVKQALADNDRLPRAHLNLLQDVEKQGHKVDRSEKRKNTKGKYITAYHITPKK